MPQAAAKEGVLAWREIYPKPLILLKESKRTNHIVMAALTLHHRNVQSLKVTVPGFQIPFIMPVSRESIGILAATMPNTFHLTKRGKNKTRKLHIWHTTRKQKEKPKELSMYRLREMDVDDKVCEQVSMTMLSEVYPKDVIEHCVQQSEPWSTKARRVRLSTTLTLVLFVIAMALWSRRNQCQVWQSLVGKLSDLHPAEPKSRSALRD